MEALATIAVSVAVGLGVGVLSGLLGVGGGTVFVPVWKLGYAMDAIAATATSLFAIIPTAVSGAVSHIRAKTCVPKLGVAAGVGGALTSPIGVWLATKSPGWLVMTVAAVIIAYSAFTMLRKALRGHAAVRAGEACRVGGAEKPSDEQVFCDQSVCFEAMRWHIVAAAGIGLLAGVASGYVGVGGGFLMVPLMTQMLRMPMKLTSGTSLIAVMILAVPGVIYQGMLGNVHWLAGIAVAAGSVPGAMLGAKLVSRVPEYALRFIFSGFLFVAAALLVLDQLAVLG